MADASPDAFRVRARAQVLDPTVRALPAIDGGFFYARNGRELICLDLRAPR